MVKRTRGSSPKKKAARGEGVLGGGSLATVVLYTDDHLPSMGGECPSRRDGRAHPVRVVSWSVDQNLTVVHFAVAARRAP